MTEYVDHRATAVQSEWFDAKWHFGQSPNSVGDDMGVIQYYLRFDSLLGIDPGPRLRSVPDRIELPENVGYTLGYYSEVVWRARAVVVSVHTVCAIQVAVGSISAAILVNHSAPLSNQGFELLNLHFPRYSGPRGQFGALGVLSSQYRMDPTRSNLTFCRSRFVNASGSGSSHHE